MLIIRGTEQILHMRATYEADLDTTPLDGASADDNNRRIFDAAFSAVVVKGEERPEPLWRRLFLLVRDRVFNGIDNRFGQLLTGNN
jgi:hypothetical protein